MASAAPTQRQPTYAFVHDARYRIVEEESEMLRDSTILRLVFVDVNRGEIITPSEVEEFIRDLNLPELRLFDQSTVGYLSENSDKDGGNAGSSDQLFAGGEESAGRAHHYTGRHQQIVQTSQFSALLFTAVVFAALLLTIFAALAVILCYYRRRFLFERKFLRDAQIAKAAMSSTKCAAPSTIRQFALANTAASAMSEDRASHFYPPNPYITDAWFAPFFRHFGFVILVNKVISMV